MVAVWTEMASDLPERIALGVRGGDGIEVW